MGRSSCVSTGLALAILASAAWTTSAVEVDGDATSEVAAEPKDSDAEGKLLALFSVVKFPNDICEGDSRNGTCYTSEECENKDGTSSGSCAEGFGVCCVFELSCGQTSNENCTYLVQTSTPTYTPCSYQICKASSNVCRIRYDFTTMVLTGPATQTVAATATNNLFESSGDCTTDSITFTGAGMGAPIICGTNSGQHLYVDASETCHLANFNIETASTATSRRWDIKVTQYECGSEHGGPPGCLQYFTATSGYVASFNFPTGSTVGADATHLSNQDYNICFRRGSGYCYICFTPTIEGSTTTTAQNTFGLSISASTTIAQSLVSTSCTSDYLEIIGGVTTTIAAIKTPADGVQRFCGRILNTQTAQATTATVCTLTRPFRIRFHTDADEVGTISGTSDAVTNEADTAPGGIIGFKLSFAQTAC